MTFQRNLGYGDDGRGGPGGDAAAIDTTNPNDSRSQSTQGSPPTAPAELPIVNASVETEDDFPLGQYVFQGEFDEYIIGHAVTADDEGVESESGANTTIAKPPQFRKSVVDALDEYTYAPDELNNLQGTRKREFQAHGGTVVLYERIDPPYAPDDTIYAGESQSTGVAGTQLVDLNGQARRWKNIEPRHKYFQITDTDRNSYYCREWDFATGAQKVDSNDVILPQVLVAKPHDLRGDTWAFQTIGGIAYETLDGTDVALPHNRRVADLAEEQEIIPPWYDDESIIRAALVEEGTGVIRNGEQAIWEDTNASGRAFSEIFVPL